MGARLGQGWRYGRPGALPTAAGTGERDAIVGLEASAHWRRSETPYELVAGSRAVQRSTKPLLVAMSKHLERQALALGGPAVVAASFQHARHFTPATVRRYAGLAASAELVVALGELMPHEPAPGVTGAALPADDPVNREWSIAVVGPHFAGAVLARDLGDRTPEAERRFDYVVTYDRELVLAAAGALLRRARLAPV
jgi:DICT domain-containing protein